MGGVKYIQQDWQGSIRTATSNTGFVVARTDHQAFGEDIGAGVGLRTSGQGYSGGKVSRQGYGLTENDQGSGQQHTWFRKLETQAGRWSSPDPYKGSMSLGDPQSFNRYSYVGNEPTNFVDPSGLLWQICDASGGYAVCNAMSGGFFGWGSGIGGGGILITNSVIQPHVEARPTLISRSYSFIPFFNGFSGGSGRNGGGNAGGSESNSECPPGPTICQAQKNFDECATASNRTYRKQYIKDSGKAVGLGVMIGLAAGGGYLLFARGKATLAGSSGFHAVDGTFSLAKGVGMALLAPYLLASAGIQNLLASGRTANDRWKREIDACKRQSPSANHNFWVLNL